MIGSISKCFGFEVLWTGMILNANQLWEIKFNYRNCKNIWQIKVKELLDRAFKTSYDISSTWVNKFANVRNQKESETGENTLFECVTLFPDFQRWYIDLIEYKRNTP